MESLNTMGCCMCVPENRVKVIERWGKFSHMAMPGFQWLNCFTESIAGELSFQVESYDLKVETRTKDNVFVIMHVTINTRILQSRAEMTGFQDKPLGDPIGIAGTSKDVEMMGLRSFHDDVEDDEDLLYRAYYRVKNPTGLMKAIMDEFFRIETMKFTMDQLFTIKKELTQNLKDQLNHEMNEFGWAVVRVILSDIELDPHVKKSMNDIVVAEKNRQTKQYVADANGQVAITTARAEAQVRELAGEGIARERQAIINGMKESVAQFKEAFPAADPNTIMTSININRYLDVLAAAAEKGSHTFILPSNPTQVTHMEESMRMAMLSTQKSTV